MCKRYINTGDPSVDLLYHLEDERTEVEAYWRLEAEKDPKSDKTKALKEKWLDIINQLSVQEQIVAEERAAREAELLKNLDNIAICDSCGARTETLPVYGWLETEYGLACPECAEEEKYWAAAKDELISGPGKVPEILNCLIPKDENE